MEWLHPVALEKKVSIDVKITRIITRDFGAKLLLDVCLVQVFADPAKSRVAEVTTILALATDIINIL